MLEPQTSKHSDVEIMVKMYDPKMEVSGNRQQMVEESTAEYVSFVDDDDLVAKDYVEKIYPLLDGVDYIGFQVETTIDGKPTLPAYHSLKYPQWYSGQPLRAPAASTCARASGRSTTSAIRPWSRSGSTAFQPRRPRCITRCGAAAFWNTTRKPAAGISTKIPDGENEMVLFKDQGLIHEITTSVSYVDNILWAVTYFGDSRYDGRYWHNFLTKDSGLPSNFINFVKGVDANRAWFCTDKGLAYYDGVNWAVYRPSLKDGKPEMTVRNAQGKVTPVAVTTAPAHNYVLGIDFQGNDIWVATAKGLSHGIRYNER